LNWIFITNEANTGVFTWETPLIISHQCLISIEVVKIGPPAEGVNYPVCLKGKLACPPEDCGGIWGYYEMLEVLEDPKHERHEELVEWIGGDFDPEQFDLDEINAELAELRTGKNRRLWDPYGM
jgi:hypothetical protein